MWIRGGCGLVEFIIAKLVRNTTVTVMTMVYNAVVSNSKLILYLLLPKYHVLFSLCVKSNLFSHSIAAFHM